MKPKLVTRLPKRLFAFGCSFTQYFWTTWPEIVANDLNIDLYNLGKSGAGNELIFNRLMQADAQYDLNENDLVMISWTNVCREDRFVNNKWITPGNIFTQSEYSSEHVKKYYSDIDSVSLHDFAYIKACRTLLQHKNCQWHFLQMLDISEFANQWELSFRYKPRHLLRTETQNILPSFYEVLWNNNVYMNKTKREESLYRLIDNHPTPQEHLKYLSSVFDHKWNSSTVDSVLRLDSDLHHFKLHQTEISDQEHLRNSVSNKIL